MEISGEALLLKDGRTFDPAFIPPTAIRLYDIEVLAEKP